MNELISIIVPVYKVENYLEKCIKSILSQTYTNLEIILVDDGSTDACPQICDQYAQIDCRIKVIHKENGGLSDARNAGLEAAKGEYIAFVDSDDYIASTMYEHLYHILKQNQGDIAICRFLKVEDGSKEEKLECKEQIETYSNVEALAKFYTEDRVQMVVVWNKLYKREIFRGLRYKKGKQHEDEFIIHRLLDRADKIVFSNQELYFYLQRSSSIMGQGFSNTNLDKIEAFRERKEYFREKGYQALYEKAASGYIAIILYDYALLKRFNPEKKEQLRELKKNFSQEYKRSYHNLSKKLRIGCILFRIHPNLFRFVLAIEKGVKHA